MKAAAARRAEEDSLWLRKVLGPEGLSSRTIDRFRLIIRRHYRAQGRTFPWRQTRDPYLILVSEFMLQQTQVDRVRGKYEQFTSLFPDVESLAASSLSEVLTLWQGLGYNRRALSLHRAARQIVGEMDGRFPRSAAELERLPGVGKATAGAVMVFAYNRPAVFVETNIRRVYIHFFFPGPEKVSDREILSLVETTLPRHGPRLWYYALMDYGAMLRRGGSDPNRKSARYQRQAPFEGSDRQVRSAILKIVLAGQPMSETSILRRLDVEQERAKRILHGLYKEGFLARRKDRIEIA